MLTPWIFNLWWPQQQTLNWLWATRITSKYILVLLWSVFNPTIVQAQVTPDSTLSTTVTTTDNLNFLIDGGDVCCPETDSRGSRNLFHSFEEFSIPTHGSAQFRNGLDIDNIIGRITGRGVSDIDGLIQANGTANLFLLNPNGFIFGPNARLNIGGSFLATTADRFLFEEDIYFSATEPSPILSIHTPLGLQMGRNANTIEVIGSGHQLQQASDVTPVNNRATESLGLDVSPQQNLALIGNQIKLNGAVLTAEEGHIELASVHQGIVELNAEATIWDFTYDGVQQFHDLTLTRSALVDVTGEPAGSIALRGSRLRLNHGSILLSQSSGDRTAGAIEIEADEFLRLRGVNANNFRSSIQAMVLEDTSRTAMGSPIRIQAPVFQLRNGAAVRTTTFGPGDSGNIQIETDNAVRVVGISPLASNFGTDVSVIAAVSIGGSGRAGNIALRSGTVQLKDGGLISSSTLLGTGDGGDIGIEANTIRLSGFNPQISGQGITAATLGDGNAGDITINTQELQVRDGNIVDSSSGAQGDAGDVNIYASEQVIIQSLNPDRPSQISSADFRLDDSLGLLIGVNSEPTGNAGNITIETPNLRIANEGLVTINTSGTGNGGELTLRADAIILEHGGMITATTTVGDGGNITIQANTLVLNNGLINASSLEAGTLGNIDIQSSESINIIGTGRDDLIFNIAVPVLLDIFQPDDITQGISAIASGNSRDGRLTLQTNRLQMSQGAIITTTAFDNGTGGDMQITANDMAIDESLLTSAAFDSSRAGNIDIETQTLNMQGGSQILTSTFGAGDAGNVAVTASESIILDGQAVATDPTNIQVTFPTGLVIGVQNSGTGNGGNLTVNSPLLMIRDQAEISASSSASSFSDFLGNQDSRPAENSVTSNIGDAGDITLNIGLLTLDEGDIDARSDTGEGGNINLLVNEGIILSDVSEISTEAGRANGENGALISNLRNGGDGGNIHIESPFIAAVGNSDIVANAVSGNGGQIDITTQSLFGIGVQDEVTLGNDITASSELGVSGTIRITTPELTPDADAVILPSTVADSTQQVTTACAQTQGSNFVITGRGGLPAEPTGEGDRPWSHILPDFGTIPSVLPPSPTPLSSTADNTMPLSIAVPREATHMVITANNTIQLVDAMGQTVRPIVPSCGAHQFPS